MRGWHSQISSLSLPKAGAAQVLQLLAQRQPISAILLPFGLFLNEQAGLHLIHISGRGVSEQGARLHQAPAGARVPARNLYQQLGRAQFPQPEFYVRRACAPARISGDN